MPLAKSIDARRKEKYRRIKYLHTKNQVEKDNGVPHGQLVVLGAGLPHSALSDTRAANVRQRTHWEEVEWDDLGPRELCYSSDEMYHSALAAQQAIEAEIAECAPKGLESLSDEDRRFAWEAAHVAANERHLDLGCAGMPVFSKLPYFRCVASIFFIIECDKIPAP